MNKKHLIVLFLLGGFILPLLSVHPALADAQGQWIDKGTIKVGNDQYIDTNPDDNTHKFEKPASSNNFCPESIQEFSPDKTHAWIHRNVTVPGSVSCLDGGRKEAVQLANPENASKAATDGAGGGSGSGTNEPSCESKGGEMSWLLCPALRLMDSALRQLDQEINSLLTIPPAYYNNAELKATWGQLRNIALIILVPITLVMVIGTALGFEIISAYTVKKTLPRFMIAVVFIVLSWPIGQFAIDITTVLGRGIGGVLGSSFGGINSITLASLFNSNGIQDGGIFLVGAMGGVAALSLLTIGILLSYAFIALLGLFIGFVLLALRQFLVIILMILAPLAILTWIFPGSNKLWKFWRESFTSLLMLYPLVIILISGGRIFAKIVHDTTGQGGDAALQGLAATFIKLIAYVGPYFFIPALFKFAGGAFATISGMANDKRRGLFDRQKKYRQAKMGETWQKTKQGERFNRSNIVARGVNRIGIGAGAGWKGRFGVGQRGMQARTRIGEVAAAENAQNNKALQQLALNSDDGIAVMALSGGTNAGAEQASQDLMRGWMQTDPNLSAADAEARRQRGLAAAQALGLTKSNAQAALPLMMQNKARSVAGGDWDTVAAGLDRLAPNNTQQRENIEGAVQYFGRTQGRGDLGDRTVARGLARTGAHELVRGYTGGVQAVADDLTTRYTAALDTGNQADAIQAAGEIAALRNAMGSATQDNREVLTNMFANVNLDIGAQQSVDEQLGSQLITRLPVTRAPEDITNEIRTRAGLYDQGTRGVVPTPVIGGGQPPPPPPPPPGP